MGWYHEDLSFIPSFNSGTYERWADGFTQSFQQETRLNAVGSSVKKKFPAAQVWWKNIDKNALSQ